MFNLSVVNIAPDAQRASINQLAALYGCGDNSLSVKLQDSNGAICWGCHSAWRPEDYATFSDEALRALVVPENLRPSLAFLYERLVMGDDAQTNWQAALAELELTVIEVPE